eukprot:10163545-Heterocapsa_arctica.AAC.1
MRTREDRVGTRWGQDETRWGQQEGQDGDKRGTRGGQRGRQEWDKEKDKRGQGGSFIFLIIETASYSL